MEHAPRIELFLTEDSVMKQSELDVEFLMACTSHLLECAGQSGPWSAGVKVCLDQEMQALHDQYMDINETTDVMAFPSDEEAYLGDVIVCKDEADRQAKDRGHDPKAELQFYILHGLLHLLGYDDKTDQQKEEMLSIQTQALSLNGVHLRS